MMQESTRTPALNALSAMVASSHRSEWSAVISSSLVYAVFVMLPGRSMRLGELLIAVFFALYSLSMRYTLRVLELLTPGQVRRWQYIVIYALLVVALVMVVASALRLGQFV